MSEIADILERAADLIEPQGGWAQEYFGIHNPGGPCCAVGAIGRAAGCRSIYECEAWVNRLVAPLLGMDAADLEAWNDAQERTQAEVVAKLREAAAKARAENSHDP